MSAIAEPRVAPAPPVTPYGGDYSPLPPKYEGPAPLTSAPLPSAIANGTDQRGALQCTLQAELEAIRRDPNAREMWAHIQARAQSELALLYEQELHPVDEALLARLAGQVYDQPRLAELIRGNIVRLLAEAARDPQLMLLAVRVCKHVPAWALESPAEREARLAAELESKRGRWRQRKQAADQPLFDGPAQSADTSGPGREAAFASPGQREARPSVIATEERAAARDTATSGAAFSAPLPDAYPAAMRGSEPLNREQRRRLAALERKAVGAQR